MFRKKINKIITNKYVIQIFTLMSGTLIAQAISLIIIPFITRMYSPDEFGEYTLFYSVVSIFGLISSFKYDQAIMLPKLDKDAKSIVLLTVIINIFVVLLLLLIVVLFHETLYEYFKNQPYLIWIVPVGILIFGSLQSIKSYSSRNQLYSTIAKVRVFNSSSIGSIQIVGRELFNSNALVLGRLILE